MIARLALFEGTVKPGLTEEFRNAVMTRLVPLWKQFPGNHGVRVMFSDSQDDGAPQFPLILSVLYPNKESIAVALESPVRYESKDATGEVVAEFFDGRIHHHITQLNNFEA